MAWIDTPADSPDPRESELLKGLHSRAKDPRTGRLDHILALHGLHPAGLEAHLALYTAVMRGTESFPKLERELVALTVSQLNGCHY